MNRKKEQGVALILTLILILVMSVMTVTLMFLSQTETWSSMNYRLMSQSRDAAEAGIHAAANYLVNTYTPPGGAGDPLSGYNSNVSPVQSPSTSTSGNDVILSASSQSSNYPATSTQTAFNTAGQGSLTASNTTVNYKAYARLTNQQQV